MNNKPRALLIAYNDLNNSGVPNVMYQTIRAIHKWYDIDIITFGKNDFYYKKLVDENILNVHLIKLSHELPKHKIGRLFYHFFSDPLFMYRKCRELIKKNNYLVVHSFKEGSGWPFLKAAKKHKISQRIYHSNINSKTYESLIVRCLENRNHKLALKYGNIFVGVSNDCCKNAFKNKTYQIIHNGYNESAFNSNVVCDLNPDELVLTQVASFNENKNQLFSLGVIKELSNIYKKTKLVLIGKKEKIEYYNKMLAFIAANHLEEFVQIIDGTNGVGDSLKRTSYTILTSHSEGAPIVSIESQASGITMFASSNVPKEMNLGGIIYLDLNLGEKHWAETIFNYYQTHGNKRQNYNMDSFSNKNFEFKIRSLYNINII